MTPRDTFAFHLNNIFTFRARALRRGGVTALPCRVRTYFLQVRFIVAYIISRIYVMPSRAMLRPMLIIALTRRYLHDVLALVDRIMNNINHIINMPIIIYDNGVMDNA